MITSSTVFDIERFGGWVRSRSPPRKPAVQARSPYLPHEDPNGRSLAVVDPQLRVHALAGLRVADASVMPRIIRGPTNAPTHMIAGRATKLILG